MASVFALHVYKPGGDMSRCRYSIEYSIDPWVSIISCAKDRWTPWPMLLSTLLTPHTTLCLLLISLHCRVVRCTVHSATVHMVHCTVYTYCSTFAHFSRRHCFAHWTYTEGNVLYLYLYLLQHLHYFRSSGQMASSLHWRVSYTHIPPLQPSGRSGKTFNSCPVNRDQIDYCYYYSTRLVLKLSKINLCLNTFWFLWFWRFGSQLPPVCHSQA